MTLEFEKYTYDAFSQAAAGKCQPGKDYVQNQTAWPWGPPGSQHQFINQHFQDTFVQPTVNPPNHIINRLTLNGLAQDRTAGTGNS